ncbi:MAG: selenocysteine-specific translation elongation factor [Gammaproteobacteria bacterium]
MIVASAGHVDHGKTLLVKALTGVDTDALPEEKARGLTIDLGFAYRDLGDGAPTGFIDVPGHERFVRTMVAGVSGIDVVMFVVAADDGPMPQTAEHLAILDLLGVTRGVVALSKVDRVDAARVAEVEAQIRALLAPTALAELPIVPVSAVTGVGVETLREHLLALKRALPPRPVRGNFRLAIDRSFLLKGAGRIVTGTVFSGQVAVGDAVRHVPGGGEVRVRGLHAHNREAASARAGQRCALNITGTGLREGDLKRGDWMVAMDAASASQRLDVEIRVLPDEPRALANRTPVHVHLGAADVTGRLVTLDGQAIAPGGRGLAQLQLDRPMHALRGDALVLRDQSARRTLGGGVVVDPLPDMRGRSRDERRACLAAMAAGNVAAALPAMLAALPGGLDLDAFCRAWNLAADEREALLAEVPLQRCGNGAIALAETRWQALETQALEALRAFHRAQPEVLGQGERELERGLRQRLLPGVFASVIEAAVSAGRVVRDGAVLRLPDHAARRSPADEALWKRVRPLLADDELKAPVVHDLATPLKMNAALLEGFLVRAAKQGLVVKVSAKRYFLPSAMARFEAVVRELAARPPRGQFTAAEFRDRVGIGRNAVIEILEYFDRIGLTHRAGDLRTLLDVKRR